MGLVGHFSVVCGADRNETRKNNLVNIFSLQKCINISIVRKDILSILYESH